MTDGARFVPAYGPIQDVVGYGFFYVTVTAIGPTIVSVLDGAGVDPVLVRYGLAIALWFLLGLTLIGVFQTQWRSIHRASREDRRSNDRPRFDSPGRLTFLACVVTIVASGTLVAVFFPRFVRALATIIVGVANVPAATIPPSAVGWVVLVGVAMGAFGYCLDRAVIGAIRRRMIHATTDSPASRQ